MNRKLKLALAALLGFSAACSTVKNAPAKGDNDIKAAEADTTELLNPRMVVMYGVRAPGVSPVAGLEPAPKADSIVSDGQKSPSQPASGTERPADE